MPTYLVVIPPSLAPSFDVIASVARDEILDRLAAAPKLLRHRKGPPGPHRDMHRVTVGSRWVLYQVDHARRSVHLISFGDRAIPECSGAESCWENEGGHVTQ